MFIVTLINQQNYGSKINTPIAEAALQIQHTLMSLAIQHCHTYQRWTVVHNFMLEKIPGIPLLNKLRVIHIYEADWSLIQRFYVAHKLSNIASNEKTVTMEQAGGRPGRSSIELATNRVLQYEIIRQQRLTAAVMYNDAKACYDRIVKNFSNLSLLREGLPREIAKLHSQTFNKIQYHIKHKLGIGPITHSNNNPSPIYGVGQGSTDASARWSFVSDALIRAFNTLSSDATIYSPINNNSINNKILGFVDDTTTLMVIHQALSNYMIMILQRDAQTWEKLLHTTGGKLEISKCKFATFKWEFDQLGRAIQKTDNNQSLSIFNSDSKTSISVPQISHKQAYKYVGVQIALDGNMEQQITIMKEKCNNFAGAFSQIFMSAKDTNQGYTTVFIPSIRYALPATSIDQKTLQKIQSPIINNVLTKIGYNRHMPRALVFAPSSIGGIGLLDLFNEQGNLKVLTTISHIRANTPLRQTIIIAIETFQTLAGLTTSALETTHPIPYVDAPWLETLRSFLHQINGQIIIPSLATIHTIRHYDTAIMNHQKSNNFTKSELQAINACRLYLKVTTIAEISNHKGTHILQCIPKGTMDTTEQPTLWQYSTSNIKWPQQSRPPPKAWYLWKKYIKAYTTGTSLLTLKQPLGNWYNTAHSQRSWIYTKYHNDIIKTSPNSTTYYTKILSRHDNVYTIQCQPHTVPQELRSPIIPYLINHDTIFCYDNIPIDNKNGLDSPKCQPIPIECNEQIHQPPFDNDKITLRGNGIIQQNRVSLYGNIMVNDNIQWTIHGNLPPTNHPTQLTIDAYSCYYTLQKTISLINNHQITTKDIIYQTSNKNLKQKITKLRHKSNSPTICMTNEYTILHTIKELLNKYTFISLQYTKQLEIFNLQQHQQLIDLINQTTQPPYTFPIANIPNIQAELLINNQLISSDITANLRKAFSIPPLWEYYKKKFSWDKECIETIDWKSHGNAISTLRNRQKKTTIQANHRWLPLNTSHSLQLSGTSQLCPFCTQCEETHEHYLSCPNPDSQQIWQSSFQHLQTKITKYSKHINKTLSQLIILAITEWRTTPKPPRPSFVTPFFHTLFTNQSTIGWDQIIQGRFACDWTTIQASLSTKVPTTWLTYIIRNIWHHTFDIWRHRCNTNVGTTPQDKRHRALIRIFPKIRSLYDKSNQIDPSDTDTIYNYTYKELILLPISTIEKWIHKADIQINESTKRYKKHTKMNNHPIKKFFQRLIPTTIFQHPRHTTTTNTILRNPVRQFISHNISQFFPPKTKYHDPLIHIPKDDFRPP
jgi:hypothetical protein